jgi:hypothetical protein
VKHVRIDTAEGQKVDGKAPEHQDVYAARKLASGRAAFFHGGNEAVKVKVSVFRNGWNRRKRWTSSL